MMEGFVRLVDQINRWIKGTCMLAAGAIFVLVMLQIVFRYVLKVSAPWTEEAARYLMIWMALLASGLAFKTGNHFRIDFLTARLGRRTDTFLAYWMSLIAGIFILCILLWGIPFATLGFFTISPGLQITLFLPYLAVPVGGAIMLLNLICFIYRLRDRRREEVP